jgi:competence protein ComEA
VKRVVFGTRPAIARESFVMHWPALLHAPRRAVIAKIVAAVAVAAFVFVVPAVSAQTKPAKPSAAKAVSVVDINRATSAELEAVPGIGKAYAAKIIGGRPYASKLQLVQKKVLSQAIYDKVKDHLIAKQ